MTKVEFINEVVRDAFRFAYDSIKDGVSHTIILQAVSDDRDATACVVLIARRYGYQASLKGWRDCINIWKSAVTNASRRLHGLEG